MQSDLSNLCLELLNNLVHFGVGIFVVECVRQDDLDANLEEVGVFAVAESLEGRGPVCSDLNGGGSSDRCGCLD